MADGSLQSGVSNVHLLTFVQTIHEAVGIEQLGSIYLSAIPYLIHADAYGFYVLDPYSQVPRRGAARGGNPRLLERWEKVGHTLDPVLKSGIDTGEPCSSTELFSAEAWQAQPLRDVLGVSSLPSVLEAPLLVDGKPAALLCFARKSTNPPFAHTDTEVLRLVAANMRAAVQHAVSYSHSREQCALLEASIETLDGMLLLSDRRGNLRYANRAARRMLDAMAGSVLRSGMLTRCLLCNIGELGSECGMAESVLGLDGIPEREPSHVIVRSVLVAGAGDAVLTVLHTGHEGRDLGKLRGLLTEREMEVLDLVVRGVPTKRIAQELFVSANTVKYHLKRIYECLCVRSRQELISKVYATCPHRQGALTS